jgi:hypothetical protein
MARNRCPTEQLGFPDSLTTENHCHVAAVELIRSLTEQDDLEIGVAFAGEGVEIELVDLLRCKPRHLAVPKEPAPVVGCDGDGLLVEDNLMVGESQGRRHFARRRRVAIAGSAAAEDAEGGKPAGTGCDGRDDR